MSEFFPPAGRAGLGAVNLKGCVRSRVHIQGGVAVGQLSLPSAVPGDHRVAAPLCPGPLAWRLHALKPGSEKEVQLFACFTRS